jgi:hypothetical protein
MEIREVYRSGDVFHLNVTAFPPHLQRFVILSQRSTLPTHFRWLAHPIHLQSQTQVERCWLPDQAELKAVRMPQVDPPYSGWLVMLNP